MITKSKLFARCVELLSADPRSSHQLGDFIGCSHATIANLRRGGISVPSVELCETIYEKLSGKELEI